MMKKVVETILDNGRQIIEIIVLIIVAIIPYRVNLQEMFKAYLADQPISPENVFWQIAFYKGGLIAAIILFVATLIVIRGINKEFTMNNRYVYHDYWYAWYWFCAKIIGIRKCSLVLVPIHMQFKLVVRATFPEYPLDECSYPEITNEPDCQISETNVDSACKEINLILEDTYLIENQQMPESKVNLRTIKISRNNGVDCSRHFSPTLIKSVVNNVRKLDQGTRINIFATTNPMNTKQIAKEAFGLGERGNVEHLYVFQQEKNDDRQFESEGHWVY